MPFDEMRFLAKVSWEGTSKELEVPCRLQLPRSVRDVPRMVLFPDKDTFMRLFRVPYCHIEADCGKGLNRTVIKAAESRLAEGTQRSWGHELLEENHRVVKPTRLEICRFLADDHPPQIVFFLTDSLFLKPHHFRTLHGDGSMSVEHGERETFQLDESCALVFDFLYRCDEDNEGRSVQWPELTARGSLASSLSEEEVLGLLSRMDDLLLLVSLAEGRRVACMELDWISQDEKVHLYRLDRSMPAERKGHSLNDRLIDPDEPFRSFLDVAFPNLRDSPQYDLLKSALASMTFFDEDTSIGTSYQRVFSALETLVLAYRRSADLVFVLPDSKDWMQLSRDLKDFLKKHPIVQGKPQKARRAMLYDNIVGLQRVSLRCATDTLLKEKNINVDDQWPLFDRKEGRSLTDIRNSITHGDCFSESQWEHVLEAEESLRILTLRILLASLGWDHQKSRVLWTDWKEQRWRAARESLSSRTEQ